MDTPKSAFENTQNKLYVLDVNTSKANLSEIDTENLKKIKISDILNDGELEYIASRYDMNDDKIVDEFSKKGPQLITFSNLIKYGSYPFPELFQDLLRIGKYGMGSHVEFEFAVDMNTAPPTFALLQLRPLVINKETSRVKWSREEEKSENVLMLSNNSLGNGVIDDISDIVFVKKDEFSSLKTFEIAKEIEKINRIMVQEGRRYVLIGPGRWGTQDRFLGIPVNWSQISNIKVLIEVSLKNFNIRPTQGTHFLQNLISRDIGYASVSLSEKDFVDWTFLNSKDAEHDLTFVKHVRLNHPLTIKLDGKCGRTLISRE
jgi:hypothetical protein